MKECDLEQFLKLTMDDGFEQETYIILKDIHKELDSTKIVSLLKRIAENNLYNISLAIQAHASASANAW